MMVYFEFIDAVCHLFMPFAPPRRPEVSSDDFGQFSGVVDAAYEHQDRIMATFLENVDENRSDVDITFKSRCDDGIKIFLMQYC